MLASLLSDLWLENRRRLLIWLVVAVMWLLLSAAAYPQLANNAWMQAAAGVFSRQASFPLAYWIVVVACVGLPVLTSLFSILEGSSLLSGSREREAMNLLLAYPLPRWKVFFSRLVYLCLITAGLSWGMTLAAGLLVHWAAGIAFDIVLRIQPASSLFALLMGSLAMFLAMWNDSIWKTRLISLGILLVFYAPYLVRAGGSETIWLLRLSPLYHALGDMPLLEPGPLWQTVVLLGVLLVVIGSASARFERMDLE